MITLPTDFKTGTKALFGDEYDAFEAALQAEPVTSLRINETKVAGTAGLQAVPWCASGYYLPERLPFTFDPLFHAGAYYVQEASSMFLEQAVKSLVKSPVRCLDLCAAPGGKSTHLCNILPEGSLLVCNEVIRSRSHILAENLQKWGNPSVLVCSNEVEEIGRLAHFFDLIVADLPCSGEGMFRKDPQSMAEWSLASVKLCAARQRKIVHEVWKVLKPGGTLIYSTCTYNTEENEENIQILMEELEAEPLVIETDGQWKISFALKYGNPAYRFLPQRTRGEGFFIAALRKTEGEARAFRLPKDKKKAAVIANPQIKAMLKEPERFKIELSGSAVKAYPVEHYECFSYLSANLRTLSSGLNVGDIKGKDIIPAHALAMSTAMNRNTFAAAEVKWDDAITYLQKDTFALDTQKGYVLLTYKGLPLGFVKQLGQRINNLYPSEWRIRAQKRPETEIESHIRVVDL